MDILRTTAHFDLLLVCSFRELDDELLQHVSVYSSIRSPSASLCVQYTFAERVPGAVRLQDTALMTVQRGYCGKRIWRRFILSVLPVQS